MHAVVCEPLLLVCVDLHVCTVHVVAGSHLYMYVAFNAAVWRPLMCGVY